MSHYDWLEKNLPTFFSGVGIDIDYHQGVIGAHGDKCYGYRFSWKEAGIPFSHGVAIYLLTSFRPFSEEVRDTDEGWVDVGKWVIENYERFKPYLPKEDQDEE